MFGVLARHNLTSMKKEAKGIKMEKTTQKPPAQYKKTSGVGEPNQSRQRNGWVRGMRNKWNRSVEGFNEGTPWRVDRDQMYDFTHYYTDAISFDEDPTRVYSGEAIWRSYIMDKYSSEYQDEKGKWVGGYINDRFYVFPDAGTPDNPDVPRDGGNQLGLAPGERTRKPRPHQYSTERRLEEARGVKTTDLMAAAASVKPIAKIASSKLPIERHSDKVYNIFKDTIEMREAGFEYETMISKVAEHYNASLIGVAQIDAFAQKLKNKHAGAFYSLEKTAAPQTFVAHRQAPIMSNNTPSILPEGTTVRHLGGNNYEAVNSPSGIQQFYFVNPQDAVELPNLDTEVQRGAEETGLLDDTDVKHIQNFPEGQAPQQGVQENIDFPVMGQEEQI